MITPVTATVVQPLLHRIGMTIDEFDRVVCATERRNEWLQVRGPEQAAQLQTFARTAVALLPASDWVLFQFNQATYFDPVDRYEVARLLYGPAATLESSLSSSLFLERPTAESLLMLADLVQLSVLHKAHAQLVTSEFANGECVSIEDGFLYVGIGPSVVGSALNALRLVDSGASLVVPEWINDLNARYQ